MYVSSVSSGLNQGGGQAEQSRERLAVIGEIAVEIAHELRNVLQIISASAYVARTDPAASLPHIVKIERNARVAHAIVDDLMALARGEAVHALPVLVADVLVAARADMNEAAVWEDAITPHDVRVRANAGLAARLLHALYDNAVKVSAPRKPTIATRARVEGDRVVLEVEDDGPGVAPELAPRIFDALVTGRTGGTGLGLALARRIAAAHGGTLSLGETPPGKRGATFRIELPAA